MNAQETDVISKRVKNYLDSRATNILDFILARLEGLEPPTL